jgi:adenylate kinase
LSNRLVCEKDGTVFNADADGVSLHGPCPECGSQLIQREDDKEETVRRRLEIYRLTTSPVLHYYDTLGVVLRIDGSGSIDVVHREINLMLAEDV